jgi:glucokinase
MAKKAKYAVGVDLGGDTIKVGATAKDGRLLFKGVVETRAEEGPARVVKQIRKGVAAAIEACGDKPIGVGVGSPGVVNAEEGIVENPPNLPGWGRIRLAKKIEKKFGVPVFIENDANAAAVGEMIFGAGKELDSFIMVTLGTGVGGGVIMNRRLVRGEHGGAGEIGHMSVDYDGEPCKCGSRGCVEAYVGREYLTARAAKRLADAPDSTIGRLIDGDLDALSPKVICEAAKAGDALANELIEETGRYLGYAFASVANLLDVTAFVVGGGVAGFGKPLFDAAKAAAKERALIPTKPRVRVRAAKLRNDAGAKGAAALVFLGNA